MRALFIVLFYVCISFAQVKIVSTVKPLADIAKAIGKEKVKVSYIIPPNVSVHMYEYKISDLRKAYKADLLLYIGSGEPNISSIINNSPKEKLLKVSDIKGIYLIRNFEFEEHNKYEEKKEHGLFHPALWLDPENAKIIAKEIFIKLSKLDPTNKSFYEKNLKIFLNETDNLLVYCRKKFNSIKNRKFISYHYTWPYFTNRFGLNYLAVIEIGHGREPTPKYIMHIISLIKKEKIKSIFAAKQFYNLKYGNLIKSQTGINIIFLDPFGENKGYIDTMKEIIDKVYNGLR